MIRLWKTLHDAKQAKETLAEKLIREKFEAFLTVLAENSHALELMTELEKNLLENRLISIPYLKNMVKNLSKSVYSVIDNLERLSGGKYTALNEVYDNIEREIRKILTGSKIPIHTPMVIPMDQIHAGHIDKVGSKMANLGELRNRYNINVPDGFALTACAYTHFAEYNDLGKKIARIQAGIDVANSQQFLEAEKEIKAVIREAVVPPEIEDAVNRISHDLEKKYGREMYWAVRSSAIGEDLENSFAGQFSSILNVPTDQILDKYKEVVASKYNARNMLYQRMKDIRSDDVNMSVGVIEMVRPMTSGVMYTVEPMRPDSGEIVISAIWGLGQLLVEGVTSADLFVLKRDPGFPVVREEIAQKEMCLKWLEAGGVEHGMTSEKECQRACLTHEQLRILAETGLKIEKYFKGPQDIEWCFDQEGNLVVVQTRPLHVLDHSRRRRLEKPVNAPVIAQQARTVVGGVGAGPVCKVTDIHEIFTFPEGAVMVLKNSSPRFIGALTKAAAVVVEKGNHTDHMASVVRELNVPCLVQVPSIFSTLRDGQEITVDATEGIIYEGLIKELLEADDTTVKEAPVDVSQTESHRLLSQMAPYIFPLHLTDPRVSDFRETSCKTWHDILRFCHETALNEIFLLKQKGKVNTIKNVYRVRTDLPFRLFVFDLFGTTVEGAKGREIEPEQVNAAPFRELWKGMTAEDVSWEGPTQQMGARDLLSAMTRTRAFEAEAEDAKSYAVVTPEYLNLSLSMGYHYVTLDCYIADDPYNNYITLSFKGGAADAKRRRLRVLLVAEILKPLGFDVTVKNDFLKARRKAEDREELLRTIYELGRMFGLTRLLDVAMEDEGMIRECARKFHERKPMLA
ncbi:MAG TPA: hypothetical protein ENK27_08160 [Desulfobulbus sp.]|nr:hypothetical protein [Desulfobulbus sp.]